MYTNQYHYQSAIKVNYIMKSLFKSKTDYLFMVIFETSKATVNDARYKVKVKVIKVNIH